MIKNSSILRNFWKELSEECVKMYPKIQEIISTPIKISFWFQFCITFTYQICRLFRLFTLTFLKVLYLDYNRELIEIFHPPGGTQCHFHLDCLLWVWATKSLANKLSIKMCFYSVDSFQKMKTKFKFFPWSNYIKKQQLEVVYEKSCKENFCKIHRKITLSEPLF